MDECGTFLNALLAFPLLICRNHFPRTTYRLFIRHGKRRWITCLGGRKISDWILESLPTNRRIRARAETLICIWNFVRISLPERWSLECRKWLSIFSGRDKWYSSKSRKIDDGLWGGRSDSDENWKGTACEPGGISRYESVFWKKKKQCERKVRSRTYSGYKNGKWEKTAMLSFPADIFFSSRDIWKGMKLLHAHAWNSFHIF